VVDTGEALGWVVLSLRCCRPLPPCTNDKLRPLACAAGGDDERLAVDAEVLVAGIVPENVAVLVDVLLLLLLVVVVVVNEESDELEAFAVAVAEAEAKAEAEAEAEAASSSAIRDNCTCVIDGARGGGSVDNGDRLSAVSSVVDRFGTVVEVRTVFCAVSSVPDG
jgi:hypothetical protein